MPRILIFGDSIAYGAWDKEGGWALRLRRFLDEKSLSKSDNYRLIYNLGVSGDTTSDILERFEFETKQRISENGEVVILFAVGINDSYFLQNVNNFRVPLEEFKKNIEKLIKLAKNFSSKIIFVGLTPVKEIKTTPISWDTKIFYKNEYIQRYNETIKQMCKKEGIYFIEIFEKLKKTKFQKLLEDGLHLNSKGHAQIFKLVKDFLIARQII